MSSHRNTFAKEFDYMNIADTTRLMSTKGQSRHNAKKKGQKVKGRSRVSEMMNQVIGIILAQLSKSDKNAHVSTKEDIKCM